MTRIDKSRPVHIGVHIDGAGRHPAAWRAPGAEPGRLFSAAYYVELAQLAERGLLDFVAMDDSFRLDDNATDRVRGKFDALLTMARIAPQTSRIGLVPTITTTHTEPFHVSKNVATLDLISGGRAGWIVDVSTTEAEARHFGRRAPAPLADLYDEAAEAIDVVRQLWDSWEDDAVIRDVPTGRYIDRDRLHYTNFEGRFFSVRGPSITPRSPQGQSLVMVAAVNDHACAVGVRHADVILVNAESLEAVRRTRQQIEAELGGATLAERGPNDGSVSVLATVDVLLGDSVESAVDARGRLDELTATSPEPSAPCDFVGTAEGFADLVEAWSAAGGVDGFVIRPSTLPDTLHRFVADVVPLLQARGLFRTSYEGTTLRDHFGLPRPDNRYAGVS